MQKNVVLRKGDALKMRVAEVKKKFKMRSDYTSLYEYEFGRQNESMIRKIRNVWNLIISDDEITKNLETLAKKMK